MPVQLTQLPKTSPSTGMKLSSQLKWQLSIIQLSREGICMHMLFAYMHLLYAHMLIDINNQN